MSRYDVVVIGSGMGGLTCAAMLAKEGMKVCVVEKNHRPGGCLQSFRRGGGIPDTGIHYVGSLREGQTMHQYLKYLGVLPRITLRGLDPEGFDLIHLEGRTFRHALGYDNFVEGLAADFPAERSGIAAYARLLQRIGGSMSLTAASMLAALRLSSRASWAIRSMGLLAFKVRLQHRATKDTTRPKRLFWGRATKTAYLLRLNRMGRPSPGFPKIRKPSTCTDNCSRGKRALRGAATARDFRVAALP